MSSQEEDSDFIFFEPPLWIQRRSFVNKVLQDSKVTSVFDYGCGEGSLLSFLIQPYEEHPITRLAGVDISHEVLEVTTKYCHPRDHEREREYLRLSPLTVDLYQGSIDVADERLLGFEAIACMEVIEHVYPPVLDKFFDIVLGTYKPKVLIVSTPNAEFNIYFPQLKYGTPEATFRVDDHKFEWSRREFQEWGNMGSTKYNYSVEYAGVGVLKGSDPAVGFATQIAIFRDLRPEEKPAITKFGSYVHIERIVFPFYDEPDKSIPEILDVIHYYMQYLCNPLIPLDDITKPNCVKLDSIWNIHRIRQLCKSRDKLREIIGTSIEFTVLDGDEIIAHKEYKLDSSEKGECESYTKNEVSDDDLDWPTSEFVENETWNNSWHNEEHNYEEDKEGWPSEGHKEDYSGWL